MISRYMVLIASEQKLMIMRPYQVYQVKQIVNCIHENCGNGYIMSLIAKFANQGGGKIKVSRDQLVALIRGVTDHSIRDGYSRFKREKQAQELAAIAAEHSLTTAALQAFVVGILERMIFDGEQLGDLMAPLDLGWKDRTHAELALMADLHPLLTKRAQGREISGLSAYEQ